MNKVVSVNLGGNAYQLEEKAHTRLEKYLSAAAKKLADDPDKDEILADFERTIAEKCDESLGKRKTVVTEPEIEKIIKEMGPVEASSAEKAEKSDDATDERPSKRLYTLGDGAMIGGVCNGLAAYFNLDVTVVRLIFILLLFVSAGTWILVYLIAMLLIPEARTPEQKAELRGERFSAQDVLKRAKQKYAEVSDPERLKAVAERTKPALSNVGQVLLRIVRVLALIAAFVLTIGVGVMTAFWIGSLWWLAFGQPHFTDQLSTISLWTVAAGVTAAYLLAMLPAAVLAYLLSQIRENKKDQPRPVGRWVAVAALLWIAAWSVLMGVGFTVAGRVRDFQATHGYVNVDGHHNICINETLCNDPIDMQAQHYYRLEGGHLQQVY